MAIRLQKELTKLKKRILSLGTMVEEHVSMAVLAVESRDLDLAKKIIEADKEVDEIEVEVEEECLKILALHQPVAVDLRFIVAVIKINNDLERIGDQATNIAERVSYLALHPFDNVRIDFGPMTEKVKFMLSSSLDALVNLDIDLAYKVCLIDGEVDEMDRAIYDQVKDAIQENREHAGFLINLFLISRHLERLADLSTNIAEEVIYMVEGEIKRHKKH